MASRIGVTGASCTARFWFSAFCIALMPTSIGYQDLASLLARERGAPSQLALDRFAARIQAATFSYSRPIGTTIPEPLGLPERQFRSAFARRLCLEDRRADHTRSTRGRSNIRPSTARTKATGCRRAMIAPRDCAGKLAAIAAGQRAPLPAAPAGAAAAGASRQTRQQKRTAINTPPAPRARSSCRMDVHHDVSAPLPPGRPPMTRMPLVVDRRRKFRAPGDGIWVLAFARGMSFLDDDAADRSARDLFRHRRHGLARAPAKLGARSGADSGAAVGRACRAIGRSNIKLSALEGADNDTGSGELVAGKDDVSRLESPAQRLGLDGRARAQGRKVSQPRRSISRRAASRSKARKRWRKS